MLSETTVPMTRSTRTSREEIATMASSIGSLCQRPVRRTWEVPVSSGAARPERPGGGAHGCGGGGRGRGGARRGDGGCGLVRLVRPAQQEGGDADADRQDELERDHVARGDRGQRVHDDRSQTPRAQRVEIEAGEEAQPLVLDGGHLDGAGGRGQDEQSDRDEQCGGGGGAHVVVPPLSGTDWSGEGMV